MFAIEPVRNSCVGGAFEIKMMNIVAAVVESPEGVSGNSRIHSYLAGPISTPKPEIEKILP